ncbi:O-methyltransferase [Dehalobacterium formicoaceticum]|uniref:O-methyltransferase n=1 Tax=Dehalobacterium formicoaceticum TaxID=51515 RepID=A0ABT1Y7B4_9FIRM|nr:O-methyltransferase [Dehalobacterium formicoaceticum]
MEIVNRGILEMMTDDCAKNHVALIAPETASYLKLLIEWGNFRRILEIGTGLGYSTLIFAQAAAKQEGAVVTIERMPERVERAREYFSLSGLQNIRSYAGDAQDVLPCLTDSFDFIFMDAAMGQYLDFFQLLFPKLAPGGLLIGDNVLFENLIFRDRYQIPRRRRTMQQRLRDFLNLVLGHSELSARLFSIGDGLVVCRRQLSVRDKMME